MYIVAQVFQICLLKEISLFEMLFDLFSFFKQDTCTGRLLTASYHPKFTFDIPRCFCESLILLLGFHIHSRIMTHTWPNDVKLSSSSFAFKSMFVNPSQILLMF